MKKDKAVLLCGIVMLSIGLFIALAAPIRSEINSWRYEIQKADDATNYETIKKVEDTCRAMITSYNTDKLTYEQYKDSANEEKQGWAEQAKMRANKTASVYNIYILENSFIWKDNVPDDVCETLGYIE